MIPTQAERGFLISLRATVLALVASALAALSLPLAGQTQPALQITSPSDGTVVTPGQTISVSVTSPGNISFKQVFIIGEQPLPTSTIASSAPAQFSLLIPQGARPGKYLLTAWGTTTGNQVQGSAPVTIDVERADLPTRLTANKSRIGFQSQGQKVPLRISGTFADGSVLDLTVSSNLAYTSSNVSVATVDGNGVVTATAAGNASITATYGQGAQSVSLSVPVTVPPPVLTSSPTALSFNGQNVGTSSSPQTATITNVSSNQGLKVGRVSVMGDFSETDNCASSSPLAVGGTCTVNVTFIPAAAGTRTGVVSIPDSMNIVALAIPLSGTGVARPTISSLSPSSGPIGTSVTVSGTNFGPTQGTSTVAFNGTAGTPTSWSATSIVAPVPTGATTGNVAVTVGGAASNGVSFTVTPSTPNITSLNPTSGSVGTSVTINGANFGSTQGTSTVKFNGTTATPTSWSATRVVVPVPTSATTGNVAVTVGGVASDGVSFTVTSSTPTITSWNPTSGSVGTSVRINGASFGSTQGTSTVKFNGTTATPTSWSATSIVVPVPTGATTGNVVVTVGGTASNGVSFMVASAPPQITIINPSRGSIETLLTITGSNFGSTQGTSSITFGGKPGSVSSWSATSIVVTVGGTAPELDVTVPVVVTVGGVASNAWNFTICGMNSTCPPGGGT